MCMRGAERVGAADGSRPVMPSLIRGWARSLLERAVAEDMVIAGLERWFSYPWPSTGPPPARWCMGEGGLVEGYRPVVKGRKRASK